MRLIRGPGLPQNFDLGIFCRRMVRTLLWAALTDHPPHVVVDTLRQVGAQNWYEGFPGEEYASIAHALIQTVHYLTSSDWSTSTGSAWVSFFMWMRKHLLDGAQEAAAQEAAAHEAAAQEAAARRAAAEREAARVAALSRGGPGTPGQVVSDVNIERVASILDDDDDEDGGYNQIMISMTRRKPGKPPRLPGRRVAVLGEALPGRGVVSRVVRGERGQAVDVPVEHAERGGDQHRVVDLAVGRALGARGGDLLPGDEPAVLAHQGGDSEQCPDLRRHLATVRVGQDLLDLGGAARQLRRRAGPVRTRAVPAPVEVRHVGGDQLSLPSREGAVAPQQDLAQVAEHRSRLRPVLEQSTDAGNLVP
jgi:hypothetical protein